eukprot:scaffold15232_cov115-Isochrysis_galbana.AAC.3
MCIPRCTGTRVRQEARPASRTDPAPPTPPSPLARFLLAGPMVTHTPCDARHVVRRNIGIVHL